MAYRVIGKSEPRADAWEKVLGRPSYAGDLAIAGMLHGRIVRSPYASARITRLDAIAAETPEIAAAAAELVRVDYEPMPGVYDPVEAMRPGAPQVHDGGNLLRAWHIRKGDAAAGLARAEVVVEQTYRTPFVDHLYLETETGVGWIDAEGVLVLRVSTQVLEHFRDVAEVLRLPHSRVRLEGAYLGGGFGGKEDVTVECLLGLLVWKTRRPVQLVFSREESFIGHGKRHPYVL